MQNIVDLDASLARTGEDIILRRMISGAAVDLNPCRASVRLANEPDHLVSGTTQDDLRIVISPTQILAANWPAGAPAAPAAPFNYDIHMPKMGDTVIVKGKKYRVENSEPIMVNGVVVRIVLITKGGAGGG